MEDILILFMKVRDVAPELIGSDPNLILALFGEITLLGLAVAVFAGIAVWRSEIVSDAAWYIAVWAVIVAVFSGGVLANPVAVTFGVIAIVMTVSSVLEWLHRQTA